MNEMKFPPMFKQVFAALKNYDFIYKAKFNKLMSDCYDDIITHREDYIEIYRNLGLELEVNPDKEFVHVICFINKKQNYLRALKACAIAYWLSKVASENTILINGEMVPGNRFGEADLNDALTEPGLKSLFDQKRGESKPHLSIDDVVKYGILEEVPGGTEGRHEYVLTGAYQYYLEFAKRVSNVMKASNHEA